MAHRRVTPVVAPWAARRAVDVSWLRKKKEPKEPKGTAKAKSRGMFGGYGSRQEQLDAMERGYDLQPSPLKQQKK